MTTQDMDTLARVWMYQEGIHCDYGDNGHGVGHFSGVHESPPDPDQPYKVGMSKGDLWRRMSNYATAFVDFYVYYLVPVQYADVFAIERFMHRALPGRKAFPSETKERGNLSEWFDCSQRDLRRAFRDLAKDPKLNPIGAFRITKNGTKISAVGR